MSNPQDPHSAPTNFPGQQPPPYPQQPTPPYGQQPPPYGQQPPPYGQPPPTPGGGFGPGPGGPGYGAPGGYGGPPGFGGPPPSGSSKTPLIIVGVVALVLVLVGGGIGGFFLLRGDDDDGDSASDDNTSSQTEEPSETEEPATPETSDPIEEPTESTSEPTEPALPPAGDDLTAITGFYTGSYICAQGKTPLTLTIAPNSASDGLDAVFSFGGGSSSTPQGSFLMAGTLQDGVLQLDATDWIVQPPGYESVDLQADVADPSARRISGQLLDPACQTFEVSR